MLRALIFTILLFTAPLALAVGEQGQTVPGGRNNNGSSATDRQNAAAIQAQTDLARQAQVNAIQDKIIAVKAARRNFAIEFDGKLSGRLTDAVTEESKRDFVVADLMQRFGGPSLDIRSPGTSLPYIVGEKNPDNAASDLTAKIGFAAENVNVAINITQAMSEGKPSLKLTPLSQRANPKQSLEEAQAALTPQDFSLEYNKNEKFTNKLAGQLDRLRPTSALSVAQLIVSSENEDLNAKPISGPVAVGPAHQGTTDPNAVSAGPEAETAPKDSRNTLLKAEDKVGLFLGKISAEVNAKLKEFDDAEQALKNQEAAANSAGGGQQAQPSNGAPSTPPSGDKGGGGGNTPTVGGGAPPPPVTMGQINPGQINPDSNAVARSGPGGQVSGPTIDAAHPSKGGFQSAPPRVLETGGKPSAETAANATQPFNGNSSPGSGAAANTPGGAPPEGGGTPPGGATMGAPSASAAGGDVATPGDPPPASDGLSDKSTVVIQYGNTDGTSESPSIAKADKAGDAMGFAGAVWNQLSSTPLGSAVAGGVVGKGLMLFVGGLVDKTCTDPKLRMDAFCVAAQAKQPSKRGPASVGTATVKGKI